MKNTINHNTENLTNLTTLQKNFYKGSVEAAKILTENIKDLNITCYVDDEVSVPKNFFNAEDVNEYFMPYALMADMPMKPAYRRRVYFQMEKTVDKMQKMLFITMQNPTFENEGSSLIVNGKEYFVKEHEGLIMRASEKHVNASYKYMKPLNEDGHIFSSWDDFVNFVLNSSDWNDEKEGGKS